MPLSLRRLITVLMLAVPSTSATGLPKSLSSTRNCTVPVGTPEPPPVAVTVAAKVAVCPKTDGLASDDKLVDVGRRTTVTWI